MEAKTGCTGLVYDARMEEHKMELEPWHPEQPDRIRLPWEALQRDGYSKRCHHLIKVSLDACVPGDEGHKPYRTILRR